ncbi:serine/threonine-protein kinase Nek1 isoform X2 [Polypterus senegalus]|uniref:serine/threonine-protein kinase Nek1 isoform X2 n=1 Tax=Polypterus senegalus TaxID=55291 RepID=UPI001962A376|nr:serine/threonine-protein kinase Nek1 isoform X2 [Polypterus senegalus]
MDKYTKVNKIGEGSFGKAVLVRSKKDGKQYVIKEISISRMSNKEREESRREVEVLAHMKHPNIVQYRESFEESGCLYIVMDYCEGGDLYKRINNQKGVLFSEDQILDWFVQICLALKHVHDRKILHRDIKSQNIFLTKDGTIQLGDFGIARVLNSTVELARTCIGTPYYLSPEICENKPYNNKSDIWALGCVLYEMCTLKHAFEAGNMKNLVLKIIRGTYPPVSLHYSYDLRNLIAQLFKRNPRDRPSVNSILEKPFVVRRIEKLLTPQLLAQEFSHAVVHIQPKPNVMPVKRSAPGPASASVAPAQKITKPAAKYGVPLNVQRSRDVVKKSGGRKPLVKHKQAQPAAMKKVSQDEERRKKYEEFVRKRRLELMEKDRKQREHLHLLKAEQVKKFEREKVNRINRAREQGWKPVLSSSGGGDGKAAFLGGRYGGGGIGIGGGGGGGGFAPVLGPACNRGQYEHFYAALDQMQRKDDMKPNEVSRSESPAPEHVVYNDPQPLPNSDAFRKELKRLEIVSRNANANRQRGQAAAEQAKQVEEFWQRKREAMLNKARAEGQLGALQKLAAIYGGKPNSAGGGKTRNKEEEEYLARLRQIRLQNFNERQQIKAKLRGEKNDSDLSDGQESNDESELRRKKIEALKVQANARMKEQVEKKRREAYEREKKVWEEHLEAKGFKVVPVLPSQAAVEQGQQEMSSKPGPSVKVVAPVISMTAALKDVGAGDVMPGITVEDSKKPEPSCPQSDKREILRRLNQNLKTRQVSDEEESKSPVILQASPSVPHQCDMKKEEKICPAGDRKKWEAHPQAVIPVAQLTMEETGLPMTEKTIGEVIKLQAMEPSRREWGKCPDVSVLKVLEEAKLQPQTLMLQDAALEISIQKTDETVKIKETETVWNSETGKQATEIIKRDSKHEDTTEAKSSTDLDLAPEPVKPSDGLDDPEDLEAEVLEEVGTKESDSEHSKTLHVAINAWEKESESLNVKPQEFGLVQENHSQAHTEQEDETNHTTEEQTAKEMTSDENQGLEPLFQRITTAAYKRTVALAILSAQSSLDESVTSRSRSVSPVKSKDKDSLLIGLSTGLFDANNPKMLRTCSLPDLNKLFRTFVVDPNPPEDMPEDNLEIEDLEDEPNKDERNISFEDTMFEEPDEDLTALQASMERLLQEHPSEEYSEDDDVAFNKNHADAVDGTEADINGVSDGEEDNRLSTESDLNEEWHSDDSDVDAASDGDQDSIFSRLEALRLNLEQEMGFENFIEAYNKIKAIHEDEDENIDIGSSIVKSILGNEHLHLYPKILHLVMADGAYQEDNNE